MTNVNTIHAASDIDVILSKLWVDGNISSTARHNIIKAVDKELR